MARARRPRRQLRRRMRPRWPAPGPRRGAGGRWRVRASADAERQPRGRRPDGPRHQDLGIGRAHGVVAVHFDERRGPARPQGSLPVGPDRGRGALPATQPASPARGTHGRASKPAMARPVPTMLVGTRRFVSPAIYGLSSAKSPRKARRLRLTLASTRSGSPERNSGPSRCTNAPLRNTGAGQLGRGRGQHQATHQVGGAPGQQRATGPPIEYPATTASRTPSSRSSPAVSSAWSSRVNGSVGRIPRPWPGGRSPPHGRARPGIGTCPAVDIGRRHPSVQATAPWATGQTGLVADEHIAPVGHESAHRDARRHPVDGRGSRRAGRAARTRSVHVVGDAAIDADSVGGEGLEEGGECAQHAQAHEHHGDDESSPGLIGPTPIDGVEGHPGDQPDDDRHDGLA